MLHHLQSDTAHTWPIDTRQFYSIFPHFMYVFMYVYVDLCIGFFFGTRMSVSYACVHVSVCMYVYMYIYIYIYIYICMYVYSAPLDTMPAPPPVIIPGCVAFLGCDPAGLRFSSQQSGSVRSREV